MGFDTRRAVLCQGRTEVFGVSRLLQGSGLGSGCEFLGGVGGYIVKSRTKPKSQANPGPPWPWIEILRLSPL